MEEALRLLASQQIRPGRFVPHPPRSNADMVESLQHDGVLRTPEVFEAFSAVDRARFWLPDYRELCYANTPLRHGHLHLSAPTIYVEALQSLMPLAPGTSFLNVGSGTGYFNSLVSFCTGPTSINHGLDIWHQSIDHSKGCCEDFGNGHIEFFHGNIYELDVQRSMRYDRIYIGACANSKSKYLYDLLEVGGILVGPFQAGDSQQLRRVVRRSERHFYVEVLKEVHFASLIEPQQDSGAVADAASSSNPPIRGSSSGRLQTEGLPGVRFKFSVNESPWCVERSHRYPETFNSAIRATLISLTREECACILPKEIWLQHIFPWCAKRWFEPLRISPASAQRHRSESDASLGETEDQGGVMVPRSRLQSCSDAASIASPAIPPSPPDSPQTRAVSSPQTRAVSSPQAGVASSPQAGAANEPESTVLPLTSLESAANPDPEELDPEEGLVEIFDDGRRSIVGAAGDPDDSREGVGMRRHVLPLRMLNLLAAAAARARAHREAANQEDADADSESDFELDHDLFGAAFDMNSDNEHVEDTET